MSYRGEKSGARKEDDFFCFWLFIFGSIFAFFHLEPTFLESFLKKPLTWGDTLDFFTPFAVVPVAYFLYSHINRYSLSNPSPHPSPKILNTLGKVSLGLGFLLYIEGHGLHLSANSIARLLESMKGSELYRATYLFDEIISHIIWDIGFFLISVGLILLASKISFKSLSWKNIVLLSIGAASFGIAFTANGIEGQTVGFSFPAAGAGFCLALFFYLGRKKEKNSNPFLYFFLSAYCLSLLLFVCWGIVHSGFPQFSELGWI